MYSFAQMGGARVQVSEATDMPEIPPQNKSQLIFHFRPGKRTLEYLAIDREQKKTKGSIDIKKISDENEIYLLLLLKTTLQKRHLKISQKGNMLNETEIS